MFYAGGTLKRSTLGSARVVFGGFPQPLAAGNRCYFLRGLYYLTFPVGSQVESPDPIMRLKIMRCMC
jgi:hypothetical protein